MCPGVESPDAERVTVTTNLEKQCTSVLAKRITFNAFMTATRNEFTRLAHALIRKWTPPSWADIGDIVQELYIGAWTTLFGKKPFNPARGVKLSRYVVFNAMSHAKRALHKARGAKLSGSADRNPSHIEKPLSAYGAADEGELLLERLLDDEPVAEQIMIMAETREEAIDRALRACTSARERVAIIAIEEGGDMDGAGRVLYDDFPTRIALRLGSEEHAARYVSRAAHDVAARLDDALAS